MKYANHIGWTDINPHEVINEISAKTIEIRAMKCTAINQEKLEFHVGGFSAHCSNQRDQEWKIEADPSETIFRIRLRKDGTWRDSSGRKYILADNPVKFYDYNF